MDEEQEELSTHEASRRSGMSQGHLASLLRQHKLEGSYNSKQKRWMVNAAALERYLTADGRLTRERRYTYATRLYQRAQQAVQGGHPAEAESLYLKAVTLFDQLYRTRGLSDSVRIRNDLGQLYCELQRYTEAETILLQAFNDKHEFIDSSLAAALSTNIYNLYMAQGRFAEAQPYLRQQQSIVAETVKRVEEQIERARMLIDQQDYYEATRILLQEVDLWKDSEIVDAATKSSLYMTLLCISLIRDEQEYVHPFLERLRSEVSAQETEAATDDAQFSYQLGEIFRRNCRYWEAKIFYHYALKLLEQEDGKAVKQLQIGLVLKCLGQLYHEQENYPESEASYLRALAVIEAQRGTTHPEVTSILRNLTKLAVDQGNYRDALPLLERARSIEKQSSLGLDDRSVGTMLYHGADRFLEQEQLAEAEALLRRALMLDEQERGPDHPEVIDDLTLLAHTLLKQDKLDEADTVARRALAIREKQGEKPNATIIIQLHLLNLIARAQHKEQEAQAFQQRIATCDALGPCSDDLDAIFAFHTAAYHALTQGRYAEAKALIEHTLIVHEHVLGKEHRHVMLYLNQLAHTYSLHGEHHLAEPVLTRILALTKHAESELPLLAATSLYQLAQSCLAQRDVMRAGRLAERACQEAEQTAGSDHVVTGIALTIKAHVLFLQHENEESAKLAQQAEHLLTRNQEACSLFQLCAEQTLAQLYNDMALREQALSQIYNGIAHCEKAEPTAQRALTEAERQLVADHPLLMFFQHSLAAALAAQKKYQEAVILYQRALMIAEQSLEPTHSFTLTLLRELGEVYQEQEQYTSAELIYKRALADAERRSEKDVLFMHMLCQQIGLVCALQGKSEEAHQYLKRCASLNISNAFSQVYQKKPSSRR